MGGKVLFDAIIENETKFVRDLSWIEGANVFEKNEFRESVFLAAAKSECLETVQVICSLMKKIWNYDQDGICRDLSGFCRKYFSG